MIEPHIHVPFDRIEDYLFHIQTYRLNLEIYFPAHSLDTLTDDDVLCLKDKLFYGPNLTFHAPFMDLSPGAVDDDVRSVTIKRFSQMFSVAEKMTPKCIVFHSGYEKWKYDQNVDVWLAESLKTWPIFIQKAQEMRVSIAIENIFEDTPNNLRLLMEECATDVFGICFDTGHFNIFSQVKLEEWIAQLGSYFVELHLHDNHKTADDHSAIGEGTFDFPLLFSMLTNNELIYTIEAHSPEATLTSMERLNELQVDS